MARLTFVVLSAVLAACLSQVFSITVEDCPSGLNRDLYLQVYKGICYEFNLFRTGEFQEAQDHCAKFGGNLIKIPNSDVQNWVQDKLTNTFHQTEAVWIGLTDHNSDNVWEWVSDGSPASSYDFWAPGQPGVTHGLGFEDCAAMEPAEGGQWHDYRCTDLLFINFGHPYICQYVPAGSSNPLTTPVKPVVTDGTPMGSTVRPTSAKPTSAPPSNAPATSAPPASAPTSSAPSTAGPAGSSIPTTRAPVKTTIIQAGSDSD